MNQSRLSSFYEACVNIAIGFTINFIANLYFIPQATGCALSIEANLMLGFIFTCISLLRSYVIRRWFNASIHRAAERMAAVETHEQREN